MGVKLGSGNVSFRLGSATPSKVYLGSAEVWATVTVPGAPTITATFGNYVGSGNTLIIYADPEDDGNSPITSRTFYFNGVAVTPDATAAGEATFYYDYSSQFVSMTATNAVGEGSASAAVEVLADN